MDSTKTPGFISDEEALKLPDFIPNTNQEQYAEDMQNIRNQNKSYDINQEKYGKGINPLKAGIAGLARGVSLGTSDIAAVKSGLISPEELRGLQEANPITSGIGQLTGGAGLIGATGGAGALTEGLGTVAQIAGIGAEGALFGAGNAASDYAMGDPDLNAQKVLSHIGIGAALGVGLGTLGKAAENILPKVYQGLKNSLSKLKAGTEDLPQTTGSIEPTASWADKFAQGIESAKNPQGKVREFVTNLDDLYKSAGKAATDMYEKMLPANLGEALGDVPVGISKNLASNTLSSIRGSILDTETDLLSPSFLKTIDSALESTESSIKRSKDSYDVHTTLRDLATDLDKGKIAKYYKQTAMTNPLDKDLAWKIRDIVRGDLKNPEVWGEAANHYSKISDTYSTYVNAKKDFASDFMKKVSGPFNSKNYVIDPAKVKSYFNSIEDVSKDLKKQHLNTFFDQVDNLSKVSENYKGFEQGADSISSHIQNVAKKNEQLSDLAKAISGKKGINDDLMSAGPLAIGAKILGVPGKAIGAILGGVKGYQAILDPYALGATLGPNFAKLQAASTIINRVGNQIEKNVKNIFEKSPIRGAIVSGTTKLSNDEYDKHTNRIQDLLNNPLMLNDHLSKSLKNIQEAMPNISSGISTSLIKGLNFLNTKIPRPDNQLLFDTKWEPTPVQKSKFSDYYNAVNSPLQTLVDIKNGQLSNETMEALNTVHPQLLQEMQHKVIESLTEKNISKLNFSTKISLSKFLGQPLNSSMLPNTILSNQIALNPAPVQPANKGQQTSSKSGIGKLDLSTRYETMPQSRQRPYK